MTGWSLLWPLQKKGTRFALLCSGKVCLSVQRDKVNRANLVKCRATSRSGVTSFKWLSASNSCQPTNLSSNASCWTWQKIWRQSPIIDSPKIFLKRPLLRCSVVWVTNGDRVRFAHPSSATLKLYHMLARPAQLPEGICQRWLYLTAKPTCK